jgi:hypothetical protein
MGTPAPASYNPLNEQHIFSLVHASLSNHMRSLPAGHQLTQTDLFAALEQGNHDRNLAALSLAPNQQRQVLANQVQYNQFSQIAGVLNTGIDVPQVSFDNVSNGRSVLSGDALEALSDTILGRISSGNIPSRPTHIHQLAQDINTRHNQRVVARGDAAQVRSALARQITYNDVLEDLQQHGFFAEAPSTSTPAQSPPPEVRRNTRRRII